MSAQTTASVLSQPARSFTPAPANLLQRKCACGGYAGLSGNCETCQQKTLTGPQAPLIQPKLKISQPNDPYEQQADRVADEVMRMPEPTVQRVVATSKQDEEDEEKEGLVQRKVAGPAPASSSTAAHSFVSNLGPGQPLDAGTRSFFEPRFSHDLSHVRVHADHRAAESAHSIQARAYTLGRDVVFGAGQYTPGTSRGQRLLAHELTHTLQQASGVVQRFIGPDEENKERLELLTAIRNGQLDSVIVTALKELKEPFRGRLVQDLQADFLETTKEGALDVTKDIAFALSILDEEASKEPVHFPSEEETQRLSENESLLLLTAISSLISDKEFGGSEVAFMVGNLVISDKELLTDLVAARFDQLLVSYPVLSANNLHGLQDILGRSVETDLRRTLDDKLGFESALTNFIMGGLQHQQAYGLMRQVLMERLVLNDQAAARNASQELSRLLQDALSAATQLVVEPSADLARTVSELVETANAAATVTGFTWDQATEEKWLSDLETIPLEMLSTTPSVEVEAGARDFAWHKATVVAIVEGAVSRSFKKVSSLYVESWLMNTALTWLPKKMAGAIVTLPIAVAMSVSGSSATSDLEKSLTGILETNFRELNNRLEERLGGELTDQVREQIHEALRQAVWEGHRERQIAEGNGVEGGGAPAWLWVDWGWSR